MKLRRRLVWPELWGDVELTAAVGIAGRELYLGLMQLAEDSGCVRDDPRAFKAHLFALERGMSVKRLAELRDGLLEIGRLIRYEVNGAAYLYLPEFHTYQVLRHPSAPTVPLPPWITWQPEQDTARHRSGTYSVYTETVPTLYRNCTETVQMAEPSPSGSHSGSSGGSLRTKRSKVPEGTKPQTGSKGSSVTKGPEKNGCSWCKKPCEETEGTHHLLQWCHDQYKETHGECPTLAPARDGKLLSALAKQHGEDAVKQAYGHYLASAKQFYAEKGWSIPMFHQDFDGLRTSKQQKPSWLRMKERVGNEGA